MLNSFHQFSYFSVTLQSQSISWFLEISLIAFQLTYISLLLLHMLMEITYFSFEVWNLKKENPHYLREKFVHNTYIRIHFTCVMIQLWKDTILHPSQRRDDLLMDRFKFDASEGMEYDHHQFFHPDPPTTDIFLLISLDSELLLQDDDSFFSFFLHFLQSIIWNHLGVDIQIKLLNLSSPKVIPRPSHWSFLKYETFVSIEIERMVNAYLFFHFSAWMMMWLLLRMHPFLWNHNRIHTHVRFCCFSMKGKELSEKPNIRHRKDVILSFRWRKNNLLIWKHFLQSYKLFAGKQISSIVLFDS